MKKGKILTKGQLAVGVMVLCLAAAIWLNSKYMPSSSKYLGETSYVSKNKGSSAVETSAKVKTNNDSSDYFSKTKSDRENARKKAIEAAEEMLDSKNLTDSDKKEALSKVQEIALNIEKEQKIESLLTAKDFKNAIAVIGESDVSIVVKSEGLTSDQTLKIQDIVTSQLGISLDKIKIIPIAK